MLPNQFCNLNYENAYSQVTMLTTTIVYHMNKAGFKRITSLVSCSIHSNGEKEKEHTNIPTMLPDFQGKQYEVKGG
jgi:hypothetical protein